MAQLKKKYNLASTSLEKEELFKIGIRQVLNQNTRLDYQNKLDTDYGVRRPQDSEIKRLPIFRVVAIAASIILLVAISKNLFFTQTHSLTELVAITLLNDQFEHPGIIKGEIYEDQINRSSAIEAFNKNDFTTAIDQYTIISERTGQDQLFLGVAYLKNQNYQQAISILSTLNESENAYSSEARWYLALSYIMIEQNGKATILLNQISPDEWQYDIGQKILNKLENSH